MNGETEQEKVNPGYSRREFVKASALTVGAAGVLSVGGQIPAQAADKPKGLPLSMAGYRFDRTKALIDGRVKIEGCDM
ncbi:MAG: twin-arginine translocation signal domain-containing protein [Desulfosarcina sp.]|nr:twin-arginine translocation signal domain-containing protein [Desulfosarcina sp.]